MSKKGQSFRLFVALMLWNVKAFSPSYNTFSVHRGGTPRCGNNDVKLFDISESNEADIYHNACVEPENLNHTNLNPTIQQRVQVLFYRAGLVTSAILLSIQAVGDASFLEGAGINIDRLRNIVDQSHMLLPMVTGASLVSCPVPKQRMIQFSTSLIGVLDVACGIASYIVPEQSILSQAAWLLSLMSLMILSIREIIYFGFEYKQECGIVLAMLPFMLNTNNQLAFATPLCALGFGVLAAGKILEPINEDFIRSNSEFLAK